MVLLRPRGFMDDQTKPHFSLPPAVILSGGAGRRMGGDKAMRLLGGRPMIAHVIERIVPQVSTLAINTPNDPKLASFGYPLIQDERFGLGPLGGLQAALRWAAGLGAHRVLTVAVDTPFLPSDLVARLEVSAETTSFAVTDNGPHATTGLWSVARSGDLDRAIGDGMRKVLDWTSAIGAAEVRFPEEMAFFNVNTPEDLRAAEAQLHP